MYVIDVARRTVLRTINTGGWPRRIAVDQRDGTVFIANETGWIDIPR